MDTTGNTYSHKKCHHQNAMTANERILIYENVVKHRVFEIWCLRSLKWYSKHPRRLQSSQRQWFYRQVDGINSSGGESVEWILKQVEFCWSPAQITVRRVHVQRFSSWNSNSKCCASDTIEIQKCLNWTKPFSRFPTDDFPVLFFWLIFPFTLITNSHSANHAANKK